MQTIHPIVQKLLDVGKFDKETVDYIGDEGLVEALPNKLTYDEAEALLTLFQEEDYDDYWGLMYLLTEKWQLYLS